LTTGHATHPSSIQGFSAIHDETKAKQGILNDLVSALSTTWTALCQVEAGTIDGSIQFDDGRPAKNFEVLIVPISQLASGQMRTVADELGKLWSRGLSPVNTPFIRLKSLRNIRFEMTCF